MQPSTKLYAEFTNSSWRVSERNFEIQDEQEAVQRALQTRAICFRIYEITSVNVGGKELKGDPENFSARRYVGMDRVYTRDEVIAAMRAEKPYPGWNVEEFNAATNEVISNFRRKPENAVFIDGLENPGDFTQIKDNEKVFDSRGRQLWPAVQPSSLRNMPAPGF